MKKHTQKEIEIAKKNMRDTVIVLIIILLALFIENFI